MERSASSSGTITLMGSGELTESMTRVHHWVVSRLDGPVKAVFLDTPAGFELNADDISERARKYVRRYVGVPCALASFKSARRATAAETKNAVRKIEGAGYIFAGPGSPTYTVRNWAGTPLIEAVARRVDEGAQLVLASAAAIAVGHYALPVYEIYKVGEEPHWLEGLNLLAPYGLDLAIVPHWNNAEGGTYDTRFCFMGKPRFDALTALLPQSGVVLGIDEYTACILLPGEGVCHVMGAGGVTVRRGGEEKTFAADSSFSLDELRGEPTSTRTAIPRAAAGVSAAQAGDNLARTLGETERMVRDGSEGEIAGQAYELAQSIERAAAVGAGGEGVLAARAALGRLVDLWGKRLAVSGDGLAADVSPFVEIIIDLRARLREAGLWALADELRDRLAALGVIVEDTAGGTTWRKS